ncbi:MAG: orotate phosphoribosyltransferase [Thermoleophilia bacterium]
MDKAELGRRLMEVAYLEGDFLLRSGKRSRYYLDKYLFETVPDVLEGIAEGLAGLMRERGVDYGRLAAPELGAVALGAAVSLQTRLPFLIVRKVGKEYGTSKDVEGAWAPGEHVAVIEDVVTSGGAAISAVQRLRGLGLVVEDLYCVVDRQEGGAEAAVREGLDLIPLFTAEELGIGKR